MNAPPKDALPLVLRELESARRKFAKFNSAHEGWAVLFEEVDELWDEVRRHERRPDLMQREAVQVAAMALRFLHDCCDLWVPRNGGTE